MSFHTNATVPKLEVEMLRLREVNAQPLGTRVDEGMAAPNSLRSSLPGDVNVGSPEQ